MINIPPGRDLLPGSSDSEAPGNNDVIGAERGSQRTNAEEEVQRMPTTSLSARGFVGIVLAAGGCAAAPRSEDEGLGAAGIIKRTDVGSSSTTTFEARALQRIAKARRFPQSDRSRLFEAVLMDDFGARPAGAIEGSISSELISSSTSSTSFVKLIAGTEKWDSLSSAFSDDGVVFPPDQEDGHHHVGVPPATTTIAGTNFPDEQDHAPVTLLPGRANRADVAARLITPQQTANALALLLSEKSDDVVAEFLPRICDRSIRMRSAPAAIASGVYLKNYLRHLHSTNDLFRAAGREEGLAALRRHLQRHLLLSAEEDDHAEEQGQGPRGAQEQDVALNLALAVWTYGRVATAEEASFVESSLVPLLDGGRTGLAPAWQDFPAAATIRAEVARVVGYFFPGLFIPFLAGCYFSAVRTNPCVAVPERVVRLRAVVTELYRVRSGAEERLRSEAVGLGRPAYPKTDADREFLSHVQNAFSIAHLQAYLQQSLQDGLSTSHHEEETGLMIGLGLLLLVLRPSAPEEEIFAEFLFRNFVEETAATIPLPVRAIAGAALLKLNLKIKETLHLMLVVSTTNEDQKTFRRSSLNEDHSPVDYHITNNLHFSLALDALPDLSPAFYEDIVLSKFVLHAMLRKTEVTNSVREIALRILLQEYKTEIWGHLRDPQILENIGDEVAKLAAPAASAPAAGGGGENPSPRVRRLACLVLRKFSLPQTLKTLRLLLQSDTEVDVLFPCAISLAGARTLGGEIATLLRRIVTDGSSAPMTARIENVQAAVRAFEAVATARPHLLDSSSPLAPHLDWLAQFAFSHADPVVRQWGWRAVAEARFFSPLPPPGSGSPSSVLTKYLEMGHAFWQDARGKFEVLVASAMALQPVPIVGGKNALDATSVTAFGSRVEQYVCRRGGLNGAEDEDCLPVPVRQGLVGALVGLGRVHPFGQEGALVVLWEHGPQSFYEKDVDAGVRAAALAAAPESKILEILSRPEGAGAVNERIRVAAVQRLLDFAAGESAAVRDTILGIMKTDSSAAVRDTILADYFRGRLKNNKNRSWEVPLDVELKLHRTIQMQADFQQLGFLVKIGEQTPRADQVLSFSLMSRKVWKVIFP